MQRRRTRTILSGASNRTPRHVDGEYLQTTQFTTLGPRRPSFHVGKDTSGRASPVLLSAGGGDRLALSSSRNKVRSARADAITYKDFRTSRLRRSVKEFLARKFKTARQAFRQLDTNHDGVLDKKEMVLGLQSLGFTLSPNESSKLEGFLDTAGGLSLGVFNRWFPFQEVSGEDCRFLGHDRAPEYQQQPAVALSEEQRQVLGPFMSELVQKCYEKSNNLATVFRVIDEDHDGMLSNEDLQRGIPKILPSLSTDEVARLSRALAPLQLNLSSFDALLRGEQAPGRKSLMDETDCLEEKSQRNTGTNPQIDTDGSNRSAEYHRTREAFSHHFETRFKGLRQAFLSLDENRSGKISQEKLKAELGINAQKRSDEAVDQSAIESLCVDGQMNFTKFSEAFRPPPTGSFNPFTGEDDMADKGRNGAVALPSRLLDAVRKRKEFLRKAGLQEAKERDDSSMKAYTQKWDCLFDRAKPMNVDIRVTAEQTLGELKKKASTYRVNFHPLFQFFDPQRKGKLRKCDVNYGMRLLLQRNVPKSVSDKLFDYFDEDGDGFVTYKDICESLMVDEGESMLTHDSSARRFMRTWQEHNPTDMSKLQMRASVLATRREQRSQTTSEHNGYVEKAKNDTDDHPQAAGQMKENYVNVLENMLDEPAKDEGAEGLKILMAKAYQSAEKFRSMFRFFDQDGNGSITAEEFKDGMRRYHMNLSEREMDALIGYIDKDGNGIIQYGELAKALTAPSYGTLPFTRRSRTHTMTNEQKAQAVKQNEAQKRAALRAVESQPAAKNILARVRERLRIGGSNTLARLFRAFDKDKDHSISLKEFRRAIAQVAGEDPDTASNDVDLVSKLLFVIGDSDGNGVIDFREFVTVLGDNQESEDAFLSRLQRDRTSGASVAEDGSSRWARASTTVPPTRFSARPPHKPTFDLTAMQPGAAGYQDEKQRFTRPQSAPLNGNSAVASTADGAVYGIAEEKRQRIQSRENRIFCSVQEREDANCLRENGRIRSLANQKADYLRRLAERPF